MKARERERDRKRERGGGTTVAGVAVIATGNM